MIVFVHELSNLLFYKIRRKKQIVKHIIIFDDVIKLDLFTRNSEITFSGWLLRLGNLKLLREDESAVPVFLTSFWNICFLVSYDRWSNKFVE